MINSYSATRGVTYVYENGFLMSKHLAKVSYGKWPFIYRPTSLKHKNHM